MPTLSQISQPPLSGLNHIDALLDVGPAWNYQTGNPENTIYYSFSFDGYALPENEDLIGPALKFTADQQEMTRLAMYYLGAVTGINFVESDGASAQVHFVNGNLTDQYVTGECLWQRSYGTFFGRVSSYEAEAVIYLDNVEFGAENADLTPGGYGYETLLHELGHMLGLKHPFDDSHTLPDSLDNTSNTLMSYTSDGEAHYLYSGYDIAALNWLYGKDGLGGSYGIDSVDGGMWLTGTAGRDWMTGTFGGDVFEGLGGNDALMGMGGIDYAFVDGARANYVIKGSGTAFTIGTGDVFADTSLTSVERLIFDDANVALDIDGNGGQAYRLYQAAFDRMPEQQGLGYWIYQLDHGMSLQDAATRFIASPEFATLYGSNNPTNEVFVNLLYQNVLNRAPEQSGFDYYMNALNAGTSRAAVLVGFSESPENKAALIGTIGTGFAYEMYDPTA